VLESASEQYRPRDRRLLAKLVPTFADRVPRGQRDGSLRPYSRFLRPKPLLSPPNSYSVVLTTLSGRRSRPTVSQKIWKRRESNSNLWICSKELWPLDHRDGRFFTYIEVMLFFLPLFSMYISIKLFYFNSIKYNLVSNAKRFSDKVYTVYLCQFSYFSNYTVHLIPSLSSKSSTFPSSCFLPHPRHSPSSKHLHGWETSGTSYICPLVSFV
jgi:hypothetical protein